MNYIRPSPPEIREPKPHREVDDARKVLSKHLSKRFAGYKKSKGAKCIQRLKGEKCSYPNGVDHQCRPPTADHVELWLKDGKPEVLTSEPYPLTAKCMQAEIDFCKAHDLKMAISGFSAHNPGWTILIEYRLNDKESL